MRGLWRPGVSPYRMYAPQRARVRDRCRFGALGRCARAVHTACGTAPLVSPHAGTRRTARRFRSFARAKAILEFRFFAKQLTLIHSMG